MFRIEDYTEDQEVTRTIGQLKTYASSNWWSGFGSGIVALGAVLGGLLLIGLYYNI